MTTLAYLDSEHIEQHFSIDVAALGTGGGPLGKSPTRRYDCVLFYFPHVGGDINNRTVLTQNRTVIRNYIRGALRLLAEGGEIQVAVMTGGGYDRQDVEALVAEDHQLAVKEKVPVAKSRFPGYVHRMTAGALGKRKREVHDPGAVLYVLEPVDNGRDRPGSISTSSSGSSSSSGDSNSTIDDLVRLRGRILIVVQALTALSDDEAEALLVTALDSHYASAPAGANSPNVLDLRRAIACTVDAAILPDTRQLNRVLYSMESKGIIVRKASVGSSKKPTWAPAPGTKGK